MAGIGVSRRRGRGLSWRILGIATALALGPSAVEAQTRAAEPRSGGQLVATFVPTNVRDVGSGPAVVLIHGLSAAMDWWDPIVPALSANFRVITVDLLGHGGTEAPETGYDIANQATLVRQAMAVLGVTSATIVGHSMGGQVATAIAELYPDVVERLVIMNTPAFEVNPELPDGVPDMPVVGQILAEIVTDEMIRNTMAATFAPGFVIPDAYVADARQLTFTALQQAQEAGEAYRTAMAINLRLAALSSQPAVLVIMSELDGVVLPTDAELYRTVPNARVEIIPGVGHSPMVEAPAITAQLIADFITGALAPAADAPATPPVPPPAVVAPVVVPAPAP